MSHKNTIWLLCKLKSVVVDIFLGWWPPSSGHWIGSYRQQWTRRGNCISFDRNNRIWSSALDWILVILFNCYTKLYLIATTRKGNQIQCYVRVRQWRCLKISLFLLLSSVVKIEKWFWGFCLVNAVQSRDWSTKFLIRDTTGKPRINLRANLQ